MKSTWKTGLSPVSPPVLPHRWWAHQLRKHISPPRQCLSQASELNPPLNWQHHTTIWRYGGILQNECRGSSKLSGGFLMSLVNDRNFENGNASIDNLKQYCRVAVCWLNDAQWMLSICLSSGTMSSAQNREQKPSPKPNNPNNMV